MQLQGVSTGALANFMSKESRNSMCVHCIDLRYHLYQKIAEQVIWSGCGLTGQSASNSLEDGVS